MATIQTRKAVGGRETYRVGYYAEGKFKFTPTLDSLDGAERIKDIIERQGADVALKVLGVQQRSRALTLREWAAKHYEAKSITLTDGTIAGYEREAERTWLPRLGEYPIDTITKDTVRDWVIWQMKQPTARSMKRHERERAAGVRKPSPLEVVSPKTVRNAHGNLSSVLQAAVDADLIPKNPAYRVELPKDGVREEKDIFTREEWDAFYEAMPDHYKPLIAFLLVTGSRIGEATAVRVSDLNHRARTVSIVRAWKKARQGQELGTPKSARSRRVVMVDEWAMVMFRELSKNKQPDDLLFTAPRGGRIFAHRFNERQFTPALERSGISKHLTPHSLRHTFASWQLMAGVPPQTVQMRLGHESLATTSKVYAHLLHEAQQQAVDAMGWEPMPAIEP